MSAKTEIQVLHECWTRKVKPLMDEISRGKISPMHKGDLLRQCFESYPVSPFKIEYMIIRCYIDPGLISINRDGQYVPTIEVRNVK
jgi:hypothetical protein